MAAAKPEKMSHAPDFTEAENEALIKQHFERRQILEGKHATGVTQKKKQAAWQEILAAVNALSTQGTRTLDQLKNRQRKMFNDWKAYKSQLAHPPTGGGPMPAVKPFYSILDDLYSEDCRITGVMGNNIEIGAPVESIGDFPSQVLFETQPVADPSGTTRAASAAE